MKKLTRASARFWRIFCARKSRWASRTEKCSHPSASAMSVIIEMLNYARGEAHPAHLVRALSFTAPGGEALPLEKVFGDAAKAKEIFARLAPA
jgi:hypothetical protein